MDIAARKRTSGVHDDKELRECSISISVGNSQSCQFILKIIVINFDALQLENSHLYQHIQNLDTLLNEFVSKFGVTRDEYITETEDSAMINNGNIIMMGKLNATTTHIK